MTKPNVIKLDLSDCKSILELHERIKETFDFPDYYGKNWDAFWDLIFGSRDNTIVEIQGVHTLSDEFKPHIKIMLELLQSNKDSMNELKEKCPQFDCRFDYRIIY